MSTAKTEDPLFYYRCILEISEQATLEDIKKAWYKKIRKLHPDKNPNPEATSATQELNEAYQILSDRASRANKKSDFSFFNKKEASEKTENSDISGTFYFAGQWSVNMLNSLNMWIIHPNLGGYTAGITLSYWLGQLFSISLPLNFNKTLKNRACRQLLSICHAYEYWHVNEVELCFGMPKNKFLWPEIINCIFRLYKTPVALNQFINNKWNFPIPELKNTDPNFYSYPNMHQYDNWSTHLTGKHLFLKHPIRTQTTDLTFFNIFEAEFYITLPVNNQKDTFIFFNEKLLPQIFEKPVINNLFEIVIKLHKSKPLNDLLEYIFDFYDIPERIAKPIRQACLLPINKESSQFKYLTF